MPGKKADPLRNMISLAFQDVTPVRLRLLFVANCLAAILFFCISETTIKEHAHAVKTVGLDAAPSVIIAHQIKIAVEQMDADLVDELLYAPHQQDGARVAADFEMWRQKVSKDLVAAAKNITYGSAEQIPLENIQMALGEYEMRAQSASDMHNQDKDQDAVTYYCSALQILQEQLLPNADALNKANADNLENTYAQTESESALSCGLVLVMGMLLTVLLLFTQIYLSGRFRRRINLPLLFATLCIGLFAQHIYSALSENGKDLKKAKEDAYNSVVALLDTRANSYAAKAAASRFLLLRQNASSQQQSFLEKTATVACFTPEHGYSETIARAQKQIESQEKINLPGFKGSLADELNNVRFEGEGQSALEALEGFGNYLATDTKMRQLENSGAHSAALKICLGYDPNSSMFPFTKFDDALGRTLEINRTHFKLAVDEAFHDLKGLVGLCQLISLLIIVCTYFGLSPRMAEYLN
jgi:hypothetical protein